MEQHQEMLAGDFLDEAEAHAKYLWGLLVSISALRAGQESAQESLVLGGLVDTESLSQKLVDDVRENPRHPAYRHLEWDDAKAAEAFRRSQARRLIEAAHGADMVSEYTDIKGVFDWETYPGKGANVIPFPFPH